jgi:signal transduction histidine kinase
MRALRTPSRVSPSRAPPTDTSTRSIALPLTVDGAVIGALSLYAAAPDAFDTDECQLLVRTKSTLDVRDEQLRQAAKVDALGRIAGGVVHDINNLLQVITLCGNELGELLPAEHRGRALVAELLEATSSASVLAKQILAFGREHGGAAPSISLGEVVSGIAPIVRRAVGPKIDVVLDVAPDAPRVAISPGQVEQLVLNLALNARDAMPDGGHLTIGVRERRDGGNGPRTELSVTDTGSGMGPEVQRKMFDAFFTTKSGTGGSGLGLAVVQRIVQQGGGHVAIESEVGSGTTVRIDFPNAAP